MRTRIRARPTSSRVGRSSRCDTTYSSTREPTSIATQELFKAAEERRQASKRNTWMRALAISQGPSPRIGLWAEVRIFISWRHRLLIRTVWSKAAPRILEEGREKRINLEEELQIQILLGCDGDFQPKNRTCERPLAVHPRFGTEGINQANCIFKLSAFAPTSIIKLYDDNRQPLLRYRAIVLV